MRRSLVLTTESARHPFRAGLAPHVLNADRPPVLARRRRRLIDDLRDFLLAYCACFVAVAAFIG